MAKNPNKKLGNRSAMPRDQGEKVAEEKSLRGENPNPPRRTSLRRALTAIRLSTEDEAIIAEENRSIYLGLPDPPRPTNDGHADGGQEAHT